MDPLATIAIANDTDELGPTRIDAVYNLAQWISRGGAIPFDADPIKGESYWNLGELIAAVNCAMFNADLSGLEGLGFAVLR